RQSVVGNSLQQAGLRQRIWRRRAPGTSWRQGRTLDGGVSGGPVSANDSDAGKDRRPRRIFAVDPRRLPFAAPRAAGRAGRIQPQGTDLQRRRGEEGVSFPAELLRKTGEDKMRTNGLVFLSCWITAAAAAGMPDADSRARALLAQMTLDEKIGQMVQVDMKA